MKKAEAWFGLVMLALYHQILHPLSQRWAQVKDGIGQVVLLSGEAGIGKSRLVQVLKGHVAAEPQVWLTPCQCSSYHQNSALYPMTDLLERVALCFEREESPQRGLSKLEGFLMQYGLPLVEAVLLRQGKQAEAQALLAPIYGWFTEGFETADLQEAQALLDELA